MWNQWINDTCLPDADYPCSGQGYPVYVVNASSAVGFGELPNERQGISIQGDNAAYDTL